MKNKWQKLRNKLCPQRLYKYGKLGLKVHDDRSLKEKLFDWLDSRIEIIDNVIFAVKQKPLKYVFHSFYDISTKQWITSVAQIKKIEKEKNLTFWTYDEMMKESARAKSKLIREQECEIKREIRERIEKIKAGKSYVKELQRDIAKGKYDVKPINNEHINTFRKK